MAEFNPEIVENGASTITEEPNLGLTHTQQEPSNGSIHGLSEQEETDPNRIEVTIANPTIPVVVLYGPAQCGKTMTLIRITRWLKDKGYRVEPLRNFRPAHDKHYQKMCDDFNLMVTQSDAQDSTGYISFMLVQVSDSVGTPICQILEAPGEYYFDKGAPKAQYPRYVQQIIHGPNRKIWCIMIEPNWADSSDRLNYVEKIRVLKTQMSPRDKTIFVYNKIDLTGFVISVGNINNKAAYNDAEYNYPGIYTPFRKQGIFGQSDAFKFVPFQTGVYNMASDGGKIFIPGHDNYPKQLWDAILKYTKG